MPRISFLLPVYNGETYLRETMASLLNQSFDDYNIVAINDGSTDRTEDIITEYEGPKIDYRKQANMGLVETLNSAMRSMDCEFVARIDADDICAPNRLERQLDFVKFTQAAAVSCRAMNIDETGRELGENNPGSDFRLCDPRFLPAREPYLPHPFLFARLDVLNELGGFRQVHLAEDSDLCWRLFETHRIALQEEVLGKYRVHMNSVASNDLSGIRMQCFYSQLAALNTDRRQNDQPEIWPDLSFKEAKSKGSIEELIETLSTNDSAFLDQLRAMTLWKYLDIWHWRKFKLSKEDLASALSARDLVDMSDDNKDWHNTLLGWVKEDQPELF